MKKILLAILLFVIFPGNIIIQSLAIASIIIILMKSAKKKLKNQIKKQNKEMIEKKNTNNKSSSNKELSYLKELKYELTEETNIEKHKTYQKSKF